MTTKNTYHHGDLRRALMETATTLLREQGVETLSMRTIAAQLGVSRTAPYRHFADKHALLCAISTEGYNRLEAALRAHFPNNPDTRLEDFADMGRAYIRFALDNPAHYHLMCNDTGLQHKPDPPLADASARAFTVLVEALQACQQQGLFIADEPLQQASFVWSSLHGYCCLLLAQAPGKVQRLIDNQDYVLRRIARAIAVDDLALD